MSRFDVGDNQRPAAGRNQALPQLVRLPKVTEHPEPGGP